MAGRFCVGVMAHPLRPRSEPIAERIGADLQAAGCEVWLRKQWQADEVEPLIAESQLLIAIGGDGAMLNVARVCAPHGVPVLGINVGRLGFLTELKLAEWNGQIIERLMKGDYRRESRMMIEAEVWRAEERIASVLALNDIVVSRARLPRAIQLDTRIDGAWATVYSADALIIASPTGSTAYALACGGPIMPPELKNILLVPVAPHLSMDRSLVLSEGAQLDITVKLLPSREAIITADGVEFCVLRSEDRVSVRAAEPVSQFVRLRPPTYFYRSLLDRLEPRLPTWTTESRLLTEEGAEADP
ncbi:MAG: NAD(+)/NADH kinase [Anaerolineaceae bacterium]|nr:NAD(+)/NADH kinase [Anaerolineaceae bacterium]